MTRATLPGIPQHDERLLSEFILQFRTKELKDYWISPVHVVKGTERPTFVAFGDPITKMTAEEMCTLQLPEDFQVYVLVEFPRPGQVYKTSWSEWKDYVANRPIWDRLDTYVFDSSMRWCLCYTHETLGSEDLIVVSGIIPQSK